MRRLSEEFYPGLLCAIIIMVLLGLPGSCFPTVVDFWDWLGPDKIIHFILFGSLEFLSLWGYRKKISSGNNYKRKVYPLTFFLSMIYGGLTEILQKYIFINRYGSIYDFFADAIGCVIGVIIFNFYAKKKLKK